MDLLTIPFLASAALKGCFGFKDGGFDRAERNFHR